MLQQFTLPDDLTDLVWNAAIATAKVTGQNPVMLLGRSKAHTAARARSVLILVLYRTLYMDRQLTMPDAQVITFAIHFGARCPFKGGRRISMPVLGGLLAVDHVQILNALKQSRSLARFVKAAQAQLAECYPAEPIFVPVAFGPPAERCVTVARLMEVQV